MKTQPFTLALILIVSVFTISFIKSKDDNNATEDAKKDLALPEKLQGKWYQTDSHWISYYNGNVIRDTTIFYKGENTLEFNGNRITSENRYGSILTNYKIIEGATNLLIFDGDTIEITKLTDNELTMHWINRNIPDNVRDQTDNYQKK